MFWYNIRNVQNLIKLFSCSNIWFAIYIIFDLYSELPYTCSNTYNSWIVMEILLYDYSTTHYSRKKQKLKWIKYRKKL